MQTYFHATDSDKLPANQRAAIQREVAGTHVNDADSRRTGSEQDAECRQQPGVCWERYIPAGTVSGSLAMRQRLHQVCRAVVGSVSTGLLGSMLGASIANWLAGRGSPARDFHHGARVGFCGGVGVALFALRKPPHPRTDGECRLALAPYDELALAGNRGLRNLRRLAPELRQKLVDLLAGVPRSPESDRAVHHLIDVLHEEDDASETRELIEKLSALVEECDGPGGAQGLRFLARAEEPIISRQFLKEGASTARVLGAGIHAACAEKAGNDPARNGSHADTETALPDFSPCDDHDRDAILRFLGAYEPWKDHLKKHLPHYESSQSLIHDVVEKSMDALSDGVEALADRVYLDGCYYLARANRGELLAQWVAEECLTDTRFIETVGEAWLMERLVTHFRCPGLSADHIADIAHNLFADGSRQEGAGRAAGPAA